LRLDQNKKIPDYLSIVEWVVGQDDSSVE